MFCCEIPRILEILVEESGGIYLEKLFSILKYESPLDNYLAGYFEKILQMLFRRMTIPLMKYLNKGSLVLFKEFLNHIDNYSIMQIVQRVLLPHIPFSADITDFDTMSQDERINYQCNWSQSNEVNTLLVDKLIGQIDTDKDSTSVTSSNISTSDIPVHVSDLLITVLQLSPSGSPFLHNLCEENCIQQLLSASFLTNAEMQSPYDLPTQIASVSVSSLNVVELLISRLCEALQPYEIQSELKKDCMPMEDTLVVLENISKFIELLASKLLDYIPTIAQQLLSHSLGDKPEVSIGGGGIDSKTHICGVTYSQNNKTLKRLGSRGYRLVKIVEVMVRLGNQNLNEALCESGCLKICIQMLNLYPLHSLLHTSVQHIIVILVEHHETSEK